ncbi:hypothetical protein KKI24_12985 [bacterium]|nr:hypothetical protein [bacterium]
MDLLQKARDLRYQYLLSNREMARMTASCPGGGISEATVRKWFSGKNPQLPRLEYLTAVEKQLKRSGRREASPLNRLWFTMSEFQLSKQEIAAFFKIELYEVDRWFKTDDPAAPTMEQLKTLREELCSRKRK